MLIASYLFTILETIANQAASPLSCIRQLVSPVYPKVEKIAHDARVVSAKIKITNGLIQIIEIRGGNKYYDESIRAAVANWCVCNKQVLPNSDFQVVFDFRLTEDAAKDGLCEVDLDQGKIIVWGLMRFTDLEHLPIATRYLPCRVDATTTLIFPSTIKITKATASSDAVKVIYQVGESSMQVVSTVKGEGSRLTIDTADGSTYYYDVHHELLNGKDSGAINFSVWPFTDEQIKIAFERELLQAINAAPTRLYKITYSSRKPNFHIKPAVGFDGKRSAFEVEGTINNAIVVYAGTKEDHLLTQTVPLKFNSKIWISDRVNDHWFIRHEEEWVTIDVQ